MVTSCSANALQVRRRVHAADAGRERPLRRDELDRGAATGQQLGGVQRRLGTVVVVDQDATLRVHGTAHHVPRVDDQVSSSPQERRVRQATRRDDDDVGLARPARSPRRRRRRSGTRRRSAWPRDTRQSTMPIRSRRRAAAAASRTWPPGTSAASSTTTSCPRSPSTRAASSPAGPAPTTTTLRRCGRGGRSRGSRSARGRSPGCGCTWRPRTGRSRRGSSWRRRTAGSGPRRPAATLATRCGSAICARVMPTRSTSPSRRAYRAVATSEIREACITGIVDGAPDLAGEARGTAPTGVPIDGITRARVASLSIVPLMTLRKSMPSSTYSRSASSASARGRVPRGCPRPSTSGCRRRSRARRLLARPVMTRRGNAIRCLEAAAELVVAPVGRRREERVEEVPVGLQLDAVEPGRDAALGGRDVVVDDAVEVPGLGDLREAAVGRLAQGRGVDHAAASRR